MPISNDQFDSRQFNQYVTLASRLTIEVLTGIGLWHIVGIAARMCFEMGLHREDIYRKLHPDGSADVIDNEIRRGCFWCVVAMDR